MSGLVFISYRRSDERELVERIHDWLEREFQPREVFLDRTNIPAGVNFPEFLERKIAQSDVVLAMIGPDCLDARDDRGRRLDNPDDHVRKEIALALQNKKVVIPVLLNGARMPNANELPEPIRLLTQRHAIELAEVRFREDVPKVISAVKQALDDAAAVQRQREIEASLRAPAPSQGGGTAIGNWHPIVAVVAIPYFVYQLLLLILTKALGISGSYMTEHTGLFVTIYCAAVIAYLVGYVRERAAHAREEIVVVTVQVVLCGILLIALLIAGLYLYGLWLGA